jgi:hypothetical protein
MTSADAGIIKQFQSNFDEIQKVIYGTSENMTDAKYDSLPNSESVHYYSFSRNNWYNVMPRIIPCVGSDGGDAKKYTLDNGKHDLLAFTTLRQKLPIIRVKKEYEKDYQVCWIRDLGFNSVRSATLKYGQEEIAKLDSRSIRAHYRILKDRQYQETVDKSIGNVPSLQEWSTYLPNYIIRFELPWYYSNDYSLGLPLFYSSTDKHFSHSYIFNDELKSLLRMRKRDPENEGCWEIIPFDMRYIHVETRSDRLSEPEIMGMYIKLLPEEVEEYKCWTRANTYGDFYIDTIEFESSPNPMKYGSKLSVEMSNDAIVYNIVWMAENKTATDNGIHNNYTTNTLEIDEGYDPIEHTSLRVGSHDIFKELPNEYTSDLFYRDFPGRPLGTHLHAFSFNRTPKTINAKVGINMKGDMKSKLTVFLKDRNPKLRTLDPENGNVIEYKSGSIKNDEHKSDGSTELPEFNLYVYMFVSRKISFHAEGDDKWKLTLDNPVFRCNKTN